MPYKLQRTRKESKTKQPVASDDDEEDEERDQAERKPKKPKAKKHAPKKRAMETDVIESEEEGHEGDEDEKQPTKPTQPTKPNKQAAVSTWLSTLFNETKARDISKLFIDAGHNALYKRFNADDEDYRDVFTRWLQLQSTRPKLPRPPRFLSSFKIDVFMNLFFTYRTSTEFHTSK
jgi:hypothetical protein